MVRVISNVLGSLPEGDHFYIELQKLGLTIEDIPLNLYGFHEALKNTFGKHHFSVESKIIKFLHESTKQGIYEEKDAAKIASQLIGVFTKEHEKEIRATKKELKHNLVRQKEFIKL